jgi:hypothetical protein
MEFKLLTRSIAIVWLEDIPESGIYQKKCDQHEIEKLSIYYFHTGL